MDEVIKINRDDITNGIAGKRGINPDGAVIHNDYGAMTPKQYVEWLIRRRNARQLEMGFAQYYSNSAEILRAGNTEYGAWHTANRYGNKMYLGYEVTQSYYGVISDAEFILNEDMTLRQVAEDFHYYKLKPNRTTIKLHKEFVSTSCPHRSWDIHGKSLNIVKDYFISKVARYMSLGKTVEDMIENEETKVPSLAPNVNTPQPYGKTLKVGKQAKQWQTGSDIPSFVIGGTYDVIASKPVKQSRSKKAYLIGKGSIATGWLLEQDVDGFKTAGGGNTNKPAGYSKNYNLPTVVYRYTKGTNYKVGNGVLTVQKALSSINYYPNVDKDNKGCDGVYGENTANAVKRFQLMHGLVADGVYGPATAKKLDSIVNK